MIWSWSLVARFSNCHEYPVNWGYPAGLCSPEIFRTCPPPSLPLASSCPGSTSDPHSLIINRYHLHDYNAYSGHTQRSIRDLNHQHYHHHLLHHHHHHHHHHPTCGLGDAHVATIAVQRRTRQGSAVFHCLQILSIHLMSNTCRIIGFVDFLLFDYY